VAEANGENLSGASAVNGDSQGQERPAQDAQAEGQERSGGRRSRDRYGRDRKERGERAPGEQSQPSADGSEPEQTQGFAQEGAAAFAPSQPVAQPVTSFAPIEQVEEAASAPAPMVQAPVQAPAPAPVVAAAPAPAPVAEVAAPALPKVQTFELPIGELAQVAEKSGLLWVNTNGERVAAVQAAIAAEPKPVHVPRERPPAPVIDQSPLMMVETKRDLADMKLPFENQTPPA
jgi:ribonuclease E